MSRNIDLSKQKLLVEINTEIGKIAVYYVKSSSDKKDFGVSINFNNNSAGKWKCPNKLYLSYFKDRNIPDLYKLNEHNKILYGYNEVTGYITKILDDHNLLFSHNRNAKVAQLVEH